jgi:hypothetical protein
MILEAKVVEFIIENSTVETIENPSLQPDLE